MLSPDYKCLKESLAKEKANENYDGSIALLKADLDITTDAISALTTAHSLIEANRLKLNVTVDPTKYRSSDLFNKPTISVEGSTQDLEAFKKLMLQDLSKFPKRHQVIEYKNGKLNF